jgi:hypothetical protein
LNQAALFSRPNRDKSPKVYPTAALACIRPSGGRTWWAHFEFTRINITPTILPKKIEDLMSVRGIGEKSFLKLKPLVTIAPAKSGGN